jgi:hypothetical protein
VSIRQNVQELRSETEARTALVLKLLRSRNTDTEGYDGRPDVARRNGALAEARKTSQKTTTTQPPHAGAEDDETGTSPTQGTSSTQDFCPSSPAPYSLQR